MKNLFLARHAEASNSYNDFDRKLTRNGIKKFQALLIREIALIPKVDYIFSSPLVRCLETAKIIKNILEFKDNVITFNEFAPGASTGDLIRIVNSFDEINFFIVGHQPDITNFISDLTTYNGGNYSYPPGTISKISFGTNAAIHQGSLQFIIPV